MSENKEPTLSGVSGGNTGCPITSSGGAQSSSKTTDDPLVSSLQNGSEGVENNADHLRAIIENVVEGIITIDERGTIESINPAALKIFGFSMEELIGRNIKMLMPEPYRGNHDSYLDNYRKTGEKNIIALGREVVGKRKNGEVFPMDLAVSEIHLPSRKIYTGIIRDISDRKQAEAQVNQLARSLQEKNQDLESVVYIASHDLRSPLVNIQGFSIELSHSCNELKKILEGSELSVEAKESIERILGEEIPEALRFIFAGVNKMDGLLSGFLSYSRMGRMAMDIRPCNLNDLLEEVLLAMNFQIQQNNAEIVKSELASCYGDHNQLSQVFTNLLDNCLKYSHPERDPVVEISSELRPLEHELVIRVSDNGMGVREEHITKIFDVFFQLNPDSAEGEGLGLAIAKRIVNRMGGRIWLESDHGTGSCFHIVLPTIKSSGF